MALLSAVVYLRGLVEQMKSIDTHRVSTYVRETKLLSLGAVKLECGRVQPAGADHHNDMPSHVVEVMHVIAVVAAADETDAEQSEIRWYGQGWSIA